MNDLDLSRIRTMNQRIVGMSLKSPAEVVQWMGAVQAQDYPAALWAIGLRTQSATDLSVEQAIADGKIIRTWPMRGTLHFVAPSDVRWMLKHLNPRVTSYDNARNRELQLNAGSFSRARKVFTRALAGGKRLTRDAMYQLLDRNKVSSAGQRGIHILAQLSREGLLCFGPREGKQHTFVLLEEWVPPVRMIPRDEALAELARRYFSSRGPATHHDFAWWSGLTLTDVRSAIDAIKREFESTVAGDRTYWMPPVSHSVSRDKSRAYFLPAFDEFLVGYTDRSASVDPKFAKRMNPGGGILSATIVMGGKTIGTWRRNVKENGVSIHVIPFLRLNATQRDSIVRGAMLYEHFVRKPVHLQFKKI